MKNKSYLTTLTNPIKDEIYNLLNNCDYLVSIILLTVLSSQNRKNKTSLHGYYMGCGIELMMLIAKVSDNKEFYQKKHGDINIKKLMFKIITVTNICLSQNVEYIQASISKDKTLKIFYRTISTLNEKLFELVDDVTLEYDNNIKKTDVIKYNFKKVENPKEKISNIKQVKKEHLMNFIKKKYGSVCQSAMMMGWMLGNGDDKMIDQLDKLGNYLANMIKVSYDFRNLEDDLDNAVDKTNNFVINFGIQEAFELFIDSKAKFIEGCIQLDLYTNTMKEVIDVIEGHVDVMINKISPDLKSQYTLT